MTRAITEHYKELLMALVCALLALWGLDMMVHNLRLVLTGLRTPGVIMANDLDCGGRGGHSCDYVPVVRFALPGGQTYVVRTTSGTSPPEFQVGQHVTVIYDPRHPESAVIDSWGDLLAPLALMVMGTFFGLLLAWPLLRLLLQRVRRAHQHTRTSNISATE
jgi:hypothetical protein